MVYSYTTDKILGMWFCLQKASINVSLTYLRELENPELNEVDMPRVYVIYHYTNASPKRKDEFCGLVYL